MSEYDVVVIGAGPGGYVAAIRCAQLGLKTICVDKWINDKQQASFGGTCLNVGCIPSKALLDSSHLYEMIKHEAKLHGFSATVKSIDLNAMHLRKDTIINNFSNGIQSLFKKNKVESLLGEASIKDNYHVEVKTDAETVTLKANNIIIATGSMPATLSIAPYSDNIVNNEGALNFDEIPTDLGIVGSGVIGLELGSVWRRLGANVTVLEALDDFLPTVDKDVSKEALKLFRQQGLDIQLGTKVIEAEDDDDYVELSYEDKQGQHELEFDKLIIATGRVPNTQNIGLEQLAINTDAKGFIEVNQYCQTSVDNIYAVGDVTSGPMLAHRASYDGTIAAENIAGKDKTTDYSSIPWIIYTSPEIAWVGQTEQQLIENNITYNVGKFPFLANGRAHAMNSPQGFVKLLTDKDGMILGMHILGPNASELIATGATAIQHKHSYHQIIDDIHAHPTLSETIHEAALSIEERTIHI